MSYTEEDTAGRPKLSLQPRGSASDITSSSPAKSSRVSLPSSLFGSGFGIGGGAMCAIDGVLNFYQSQMILERLSYWLRQRLEYGTGKGAVVNNSAIF